jgi:hypothetical protein
MDISSGSALIGVAVGALIAGAFTLRAKRNDYVNDYFKIVLSKRVEAYEHLEALIRMYKSTVVDKDNKAYHIAFASDELSSTAFYKMTEATNNGLWLTHETSDVLRDLNYILFGEPDKKDERIAFGKQHYEEVATLREKLEKCLASDMLELHKIAKFLKARKRRISGFNMVKLEHHTKD